MGCAEIIRDLGQNRNRVKSRYLDSIDFEYGVPEGLMSSSVIKYLESFILRGDLDIERTSRVHSLSIAGRRDRTWIPRVYYNYGSLK